MTATQITNHREIRSDRVLWAVNEFNHGQRYMLVATGPGIQFNAHFDASQWAEFQKLVQPS